MQEQPEEAIAETPITAAPKRGFARRCGRFALWGCGSFATLAGALVLGLLVVLSRGPVETETVARTAEKLFADLGGPGAVARVGAAGLDWSLGGGVAITLTDVSVERDTALRLALPKTVVRLALLPLLVGDIRPRAVEITDPRLAFDTAELRERADPEVAPRPAPSTAPDPSAAAPVPAAPKVPVSTRLAEAADLAVERALGLARAQGFETVTLRGGRIDMRHVDQAGVEHRVPLEDLEVDAIVDGRAGALDASLSAKGGVGRWSMRLTRTDRPDGTHDLAFVAEDVTPQDFVGGPGFSVTMPFYPSLKLGFGADGRFAGADLDLRLGAGVLRFGRLPEDEILFDEVTAKAVWNPRDRVFAIERAAAAIGETRWNLHGRITPPMEVDGIWRWQVDIDEGALAPRDVAGAPVPVLGGSAFGSWNPKPAFLDIEMGEVRFGQATLRSAGRLDLSGSDPRFTYDMQFSPLTAAEIAHAWPHWVAVDARTWFVRNMSAGRVSDLRIRLDMPRFDRPETWPGNALQLSGRFEGVRFAPLGNLPAVTAAEGRVAVADRRFEAVVDRARVATRGREPSLEGLRFTVVDIFQKPARGAVRLARLAGDVASLAEIVDAEPIAALSQAGIAAAGLVGTGTVGAQIDIVFNEPLDVKSIDYRIEAQLDGFAAQQPIQGRKFQDGKFKIVADVRGLDVSGRAVVDGVPADVHVFEARGGSKATERRDFRMEVDDAARQRLGLDLGGLVEGAIGLSVSQPDPAQTKSRIEADLGPAKVNLSALGWTKGAGVPAKAVFDLWEDDKGLHLDNIAVDGEGLVMRGSVLLDKDRNPISGDFSRFGLKKGDNAKVRFTRGPDKAVTVVFEATSFDARGLLLSHRKPTPPGGSGASPDLVLKLKATALQGFNDVAFQDVTVDGRWRAGAFQTLEVRARAAGSRKPLSLAIRPDGSGRRLTAASEDAGAALSFLDLFDRIQGGTLTLSARLPSPGVSDGTLRLVDFHLLEEPKSGRGSASSQEADGTRRIQLRRVEIDRSTNFDRAQVRFAVRDGIVDVPEAVAKGASVGATVNGQVDLASQRLSLSGTYIPAFGLNNLAGQIPIFGAITGSGANEGLVGVTFRVVGPIDDPILQINPLSAVAPGIFRRIFEFQKEERLPGGGGDPNAPTRITPDAGPTRITP